MAILWITVIGFVICLGIGGGIFFFGVRSAVNPEDATRVDLLDTPNPNKDQK